MIGGGHHIFKASIGVSENLRGPDIPEVGCIFFAAFPVGPRPESQSSVFSGHQETSFQPFFKVFIKVSWECPTHCFVPSDNLFSEPSQMRRVTKERDFEFLPLTNGQKYGVNENMINI